MQSRRTLYRCFGADDRLLYVGISSNPPDRLATHRRSWWGHQIANVTTVEYASGDEARKAERTAITSEGPRFNRQGRWSDRSAWTVESYRDFYDATRFGPFSGHVARRLQQTRDECLNRFGIDITNQTKGSAA
jgi:hypothetical protein